MSTCVTNCVELVMPELELIIQEFDHWSGLKEDAFAATCTSCWAMPEFPETDE